jgi:hypothetical protein
MELNIGGFKNTTNSDKGGLSLDLSKSEGGTTNEGGNSMEGSQQIVPDVTTQVKPEDQKVVGTPEEQKTTNSPEGVNPEVLSQVDKKPVVDITLPVNNKELPNAPSGDGSGQNVEINDELVLKRLSEKLGRSITSLDELNTTKEDPLEKDPYLKALAEWRNKTGRPIEDWIKYQKDYSKVNDLDVARELLQHEYPTLTEDEIQFELKRNFISSETDLDDEISAKSLDLKKYASRGRAVLGELVSKLDTPSMTNLPPEIEKEVNYSRKVREHFEKADKDQESYLSSIKQFSSKAESLPLKLSDDLTINFKLPEETRKSLPNIIENAPHWRNEDGSWNHEAVVKDAIKISHFEDMMRLAYEQGVNSGKDSLIKDAKNVTLDGRNSSEANLPNSSKGIVIEGLDDYLGNKGVKMRFGKKN